jgi:DNA-binding protein H-NS
LCDYHWSGGLPGSSSQTFVLEPSFLTSDLAMDTAHFNSLSLDELWMLHQQVTASLTQKILVQKAHLEERLHRIGLAEKATRSDRKRRSYPPVRPKYRNPKNPAETWSGRGRLPRWLQPQLRGGRKLDEFLIEQASAQKRQTN